MWSLGVVIFVLLSGGMPFLGPQEVQMRRIMRGEYHVEPKRWRHVSKLALDFVGALLVVDPRKRLTAEGALRHEWIARQARRETDHIDRPIVEALREFSQAPMFWRAAMLMVALSLPGEEQRSVGGIFLDLDTEGTGEITKEQLRRVLQGEFQLPHDEVQAIFHALDTRHQEVVHYSEFLAATFSARVGVRDDLVFQAFRRFDTHNTGKIDLRSLKEVLGESFEDMKVEDILEQVPHHGDVIDYSEFRRYLHNESMCPKKVPKFTLEPLHARLPKAVNLTGEPYHGQSFGNLSLQTLSCPLSDSNIRLDTLPVLPGAVPGDPEAH